MTQLLSLKYMRLPDMDGDVFENYANDSNKDDYEVEEDGLELIVNNEVWIFYEQILNQWKLSSTYRSAFHYPFEMMFSRDSIFFWLFHSYNHRLCIGTISNGINDIFKVLSLFFIFAF